MHIIAYTMVNVNLIYLLNPQTLLKKNYISCPPSVLKHTVNETSNDFHG